MRFLESLPALGKLNKSEKNNMENFKGSIALVKDQIDEYLSVMRIGVITSIDDSSLFAQLAFADSSSARFASKDILLLKDKAELYTFLLSSPEKIPLGDFKLLFQVSMLQDRGDSSSHISACQLLKSSPSALTLATEPLSERLQSRHTGHQANTPSR
ncbi:hypothetical protein [Pedobacter jamesrossensis]|uniref:Uncharacterized protein n=1 Tax=Pedobacter jamesrossensis TaxID=1908238 RepID=A0ABV8NN69_9SPHI